MVRHLLNVAHNRLLLLCLGIEQFKFLQCQGGKIGGSPGPKILRGNLLSTDLSQVIVEVLGIDSTPVAVLVDVLEQLVAGQVSALFDDASQPPIGDIGFVADAVLPSETLAS